MSEKIIQAKESGFCHGVKAAVQKANEQAANMDKSKVYLFGDLANNRQVMADFKRKGFVVTDNIGAIEPGSTVIIRAHGVGQDIYEALEKKNISLIDCTCPKVKNIHKIVQEKCRQGYCVIIVGRKDHPEIRGIMGWCREGQCIVVESEICLDELGPPPLCIVGQTTCKRQWWNRVVDLVKEKSPSVEIYDTLCDVIDRRIAEAVEIAKKSDMMIIVGDKKSANSMELYEACKAVCKTCVLVSSLEELVDLKTGAYPVIGIAGSASAPEETVDKIREFLVFQEFLTQAKGEIEAAGDKYLSEMTRERKGKPFIEAALKSLAEQNQGGKRVRGAMIKLGEVVAKSNSQQYYYLPVAVAYEIFQTAVLIHDDIIDKSHTRRGRATIHSQETDYHFGISRGICIGDYGFFLANRMLAESGLPPDVLGRLIRLFSHIQLKTIEGEIMDVSLPYYSMDIFSDYESYMDLVGSIFECKTAWYTLVGPMMLGALCGGGDDALLDVLSNITMPLGIAFQIKDDLLGIYGGEEQLGKPALSDIIEKKQTLLYGYAYKHSTPAQKEQLDKRYGNPKADFSDLEVIREIFTATGAKAFGEREVDRLSLVSLDLIDKLDSENTPLLRGLVHYLTTRRF